MKARRRQPASGMATLFFAAIILPLLFFLFALSVDLISYYRLNQAVQQRVDQAALYAYRYLPYQEAARQAAHEYLAKESALLSHTQVRVTADTISLSVEGTAPLFFAKFFNPDIGLPISAYASARGQPSDVYLAIDTSAYLGPGLRDAPWGDEPAWPASSFFSDDYVARDGQGNVSPRNATQQCANPVFSHLKRSAIAAYEYLAGFQMNTLGVGFFPGQRDIDESRNILASSDTIETGGQAQFPDFREGTIGPDILCAALAERESSHHAYRFPAANTSIPGLWQPPSGAPTYRVIPQAWRFNTEYQPYLTAQEVIWSAMRRPEFPETDQIIAAVWGKFSEAPSLTRRGASQALTRKVGIIISGDVPWTLDRITQPNGEITLVPRRFPHPAAQASLLGELQTIVDQARRNPRSHLPADIQLVIVRHQNSPGSLDSDVSQLQTFLEGLIDEELERDLRLSAIYVRSPDELVERMSGLLVLRGRAALLAK